MKFDKWKPALARICKLRSYFECIFSLCFGLENIKVTKVWDIFYVENYAPNVPVRDRPQKISLNHFSND